MLCPSAILLASVFSPCWPLPNNPGGVVLCQRWKHLSRQSSSFGASANCGYRQPISRNEARRKRTLRRSLASCPTTCRGYTRNHPQSAEGVIAKDPRSPNPTRPDRRRLMPSPVFREMPEQRKRRRERDGEIADEEESAAFHLISCNSWPL